MSKKPAWCNRGMIESPFYTAVCLSEEAFHRALKQMKLPKKDWPSFMQSRYADATVHMFDSGRSHAAIVCMRGWEGREPIEIAGLLVHEATHMWQEYCEQIGEHSPSKEFEAYGIQALSQSLMQGFVDAQKANGC